MVGRNAGIDEVRRRRKQEALPEDDQAISDLDDAEQEVAERLDGSHYRDDVLRLLFVCGHPELPATQQIALALRIVSGLSVRQIARAFLVSEAAMERGGALTSSSTSTLRRTTASWMNGSTEISSWISRTSALNDN